MLYRLVKIMMTCALKLFYKRILTEDLHRIPPRGAAILIANHPSSLMDAAVLGISSPRPLYFFARGDIFRHPLAARLLRALHMYPIHHHQEGRNTLNHNDQSFAAAMDLLHKGEVLLFFPEGISQVAYRLQPFKKGSFRLAFAANIPIPDVSAGNVSAPSTCKDVPVVPLALNYSHPTHLFQTVWLRAGQPLALQPLLNAYPGAPAAALRQLTEEAYQSIQSLAIANNEYPQEVFELLRLWRNDPASERAGTYRIRTEKKLAAGAGKNMSELKPLLEDYKNAAKKAGLQPEQTFQPGQPALPAFPLWAGLPLALAGWLLHALPLLLARRIADSKVTRIDFYSWVLVVLSCFLWLGWTALLSTCLFLLLPVANACALLALYLLTGWLTWKYYAYFLSWKAGNSAKKLPAVLQSELQAKRKNIINRLTALTL